MWDQLVEFFQSIQSNIVPFLLGLFMWGIVYSFFRQLIRRIKNESSYTERRDATVIAALRAENKALHIKIAELEEPDTVETRLRRLEHVSGIGGYRGSVPEVRVAVEVPIDPADDEMADMRPGVRLEDTPRPRQVAFIEPSKVSK